MERSLILWPASLPLFVLGLLWEDLGSSSFPPQCLAPILSEDLKQINYLQTTVSSLSALTNVFSSSLLYDKLLAKPRNSYEFPLGMLTSAWRFSVGGHFSLRVHIQFSWL